MKVLVMLYDVFISHASEDKESFVRLLAENLKQNHIEVWYDEFTLKPGDSIRRSIDFGLSKSRFGIVVFSKAFFKKEWTQWELDGLVQRLNRTKTNLIIPIWHDVNYDDVLEYSPSLSDRKAIPSNQGMDYIIREILKVIKPEGSTLITARDVLIEYGFEPPVITDDWWIDVIEFMGSEYHINRWGFPLTPKNKSSFSRGEEIAWAAMQMLWQQDAEYLEITQISLPDEVLTFIELAPGLSTMCHSYPDYLAGYAQQLTIKGYGGEFEEDFEKLYVECIYQQQNVMATTNKDDLAFRHPSLFNIEPSHIARHFIQGEIFGVDIQYYELFDYIIWFLSNKSSWFPDNIKSYLIQGFKDWNIWPWPDYDIHINGNTHRINSHLLDKLMEADSFTQFNLNESLINEIKHRISNSILILDLEESIDELYDRFISECFIKGWFDANERRKMNKQKNTRRSFNSNSNE